MKVLTLLIKKEIKIALRQRLIRIMAIIIVLLLSTALWAGYITYNQQQENVELAQEQRRIEWLHQIDKNPHTAAHYGTFVFKPKTLLSLFDFGLDTFTGTSKYLEAHYQHEFMFRPAQEYSSTIRFGQLSAALVFQLLIPLLVIFLSFNSFTSERENGTLRLLMSQHISYGTIATGKIAAILLILFSLLVPLFTVALIFSNNYINANVIQDLSFRILLLLVLYALYIVIFVSLSVWVSMLSKTGRNSLLILLSIWVFFAVIVPKTATGLGTQLTPLPSLKIFRNTIADDIKNGLEGDLSASERRKELEKTYLKKYQKDSLHQLPINFLGISLQAGEDYAAKVYDHHWQKLEQTIEKQNAISSWASFISPYIAIRNLSMALTSTDVNAYFHFHKHTEVYRRNLVKKMNMDLAKNSKNGEFFEYKANENLWKTIAPFAYTTTSVNRVIASYFIEIVAIFTWIILLLFAIYSYSKKIKASYV